MNERILKEGVAKNEYKEPKRTIVEKDIDFVLTAKKIVCNKLTSCTSDYIDSVGYLIDIKGNITRDLSNAFVFKLSCVMAIDDYGNKTNEWELVSERNNTIRCYKNGLFIEAMPLENAERWLNNHPLPRKNISKMTKGNVFAKYNGHCAYCGCELLINEMQVDHLVAYMGEGGEDTFDNYMPSCEVCNRVKSNRTLESFRKHIQHCGEIHRNRKKPIMADSDKIAIKYGLESENKEIKFFFETYKPNIKLNKIKEILL